MNFHLNSSKRKFDNHIINTVHDFRVLIIGNKLTWTNIIGNVPLFFLLNSFSSLCGQRHLKASYYNCSKSTLACCLPVRFVTSVKKGFPLQKRAIRRINNVAYDESGVKHFKESKTLTIFRFYIVELLKYYFKQRQM